VVNAASDYVSQLHYAVFTTLPCLTFGAGGYQPLSAEAITGLVQCAFLK